MKPGAISILAAVMLTCVARAETDVEKEIKLLTDMRQTVELQGIRGFLSRATTEGWRAPHIHSAYWVDKLPHDQADRIRLEKERRRFGLAAASALDEMSLVLLKPAGNAQREVQTDQALAWAQWIRTERGYGNLQLFSRAQNLAVIPLGQLIVDTNFPMAKLEAFKGRYSSEADDLEFQLAVLNEETPKPIELPAGESTADRAKRVEYAWNLGWQAMMKWAETNNANTTLRNAALRNRLPPDLAFYCDDDDITADTPRTPARLWESKRHMSLCVYGSRDGAIQELDHLLSFRRQVGEFPTNPPAWYKAGDNWTPVQAAFEKAWQPYESTFGNYALAVAKTYEAIKSHHFSDWETSELASAQRK